MLHFSEKAKLKWLLITIMGHYGNEYNQKHQRKLSLDGYSVYSMAITVKNVPIVIGLWHSVHYLP